MKTQPGRTYAALAALAVASTAVYFAAFTGPMWLPWYYAEPHLDTPKLMGVTPEALVRFLLAGTALVALYLVAFRLSAALRSRRSALVVLALAVLPAAAALPMYPGGAGDIFAYLAEADLVLRYHANPFITPAASFPDHPLLPYLDFPFETTHYGPLWLAIGVALRGLAGPDLLPGLLVFKAAAALFLLATAWVVYQYLFRRQSDAAVPAALLVAWNPLLIFELAGNGHNDIAMMFFVALAFYLRERTPEGSVRQVRDSPSREVEESRGHPKPRHTPLELCPRPRMRPGPASFRTRRPAPFLPYLAVTMLLAAALVKYVAIILVPLFLVAMLRRSGSPRRWIARAALYALGVAAAAAAMATVVGIKGTLGVVDSQSRWFTTSLAAVAHLWLSQSMPAEEAAGVVGNAARAIFAAIYLVELRFLWLRPEGLAAGTFRSVLFLTLVVVAWFQPWYLTWAIPLAALAATPSSRAAIFGLTLGAFGTHAVMGFAWRLDWGGGNLIALNAAGVSITWMPAVAAVAWASLSSRWRPARGGV